MGFELLFKPIKYTENIVYLIREHSNEYNEHLLAKTAQQLLWVVLWMFQRTKLFRKFTKKEKLIKLWNGLQYIVQYVKSRIQ